MVVLRKYVYQSKPWKFLVHSTKDSPWALAGVTVAFCGVGYLIANQLSDWQTKMAYSSERLQEIESRARIHHAEQRTRNARVQEMIADMRDGRNTDKYDDVYWKVFGHKNNPEKTAAGVEKAKS